MKLVYIANKINGTSGIQRMIAFQINYFIENNDYEIDLVLLEQNEIEDKNFFELNENVSLHYLKRATTNVKSIYAKIKALNITLKKIKPQIVVACESDMFSLYLPRFIKGNFKLIYQRHDTKKLNFEGVNNTAKAKVLNKVKKRLLARAGRHYDKFVLLSEAHRVDWLRVKNIEIINNPVIINTEKRIAKLENKQVLAIGRHDPIKGFDMLLKCWKKVAKKHPEWKLIIVGKATHNLDLLKLAEKLNITDSVTFKGHTKDVSSIYLDSSILLCSSRIEAFPLVVMEAMSFGIPVVSFDCDYGPREIISHAVDGILVPQNNIDILADSTCHLIKDEHIRKEMGKMASKNIERFSVEKIMNQWKALFEELVLK